MTSCKQTITFSCSSIKLMAVFSKYMSSSSVGSWLLLAWSHRGMARWRDKWCFECCCYLLLNFVNSYPWQVCCPLCLWSTKFGGSNGLLQKSNESWRPIFSLCWCHLVACSILSAYLTFQNLFFESACSCNVELSLFCVEAEKSGIFHLSLPLHGTALLQDLKTPAELQLSQAATESCELPTCDQSPREERRKKSQTHSELLCMWLLDEEWPERENTSCHTYTFYIVSATILNVWRNSWPSSDSFSPLSSPKANWWHRHQALVLASSSTTSRASIRPSISSKKENARNKKKKN